MGADVFGFFYFKIKGNMDEMMSFPFFFFKATKHMRNVLLKSFQVLNVKTQLKPDSTAFYRNTQPSVTLGS